MASVSSRAKGATVTYIPVTPPGLRVDTREFTSRLGLVRSGAHHLLAYPAQSNFSGVQHPLEWIAEAQSQGWDVLLEAASFAPSNRLDLGQWRADFVSLRGYLVSMRKQGVALLAALHSIFTGQPLYPALG